MKLSLLMYSHQNSDYSIVLSWIQRTGLEKLPFQYSMNAFWYSRVARKAFITSELKFAPYAVLTPSLTMLNAASVLMARKPAKGNQQLTLSSL